ncbi:MAG: hypothetical protein PHS34_08275 [Candidatus Omnitrophica bacterium]|nr:hypothetical protein [Candidatus Omnitrophota bacterium]
MAYNNAIPQATDLLSQSQVDILNNFIAIKTWVDINHETFSSANSGKHKFVTCTEQASDPVTAINEMAIFSKDVAGSTALFLRKENNGTVIDFTTSTLAASGTATLPCGLIMKWGTGTIASGSATSAVITFGAAFSTSIYNVQVTPYGSRSGGAAQDYVLNAIDLTTANFKVTRTPTYVGAAVSFYYLALGV